MRIGPIMIEIPAFLKILFIPHPFQVKVWFQNRRTKNKREVTEEDQAHGMQMEKREREDDKEDDGDLNIIEYDEEDDYVDHHQASESHHI